MPAEPFEKFRKVSTANTKDYLVHLTTDLYPTEVLYAAKAELGDKVITDYFAEMYMFGIKAQQTNTQIQAAQATGILLTHGKLQKWLKSKNIVDIVDLQNTEVLRVFLSHHIKQMEESLELFKIISQAFIEGGKQ